MTGSVRQRTDMACHWLQDAFMATGEITTGPTKHSQACTRRTTMNIRQSLFATLAAALVMSAAGCAVTRGQESVGAYVDDTAITTALKGRYLDNKDVDAILAYRQEAGVLNDPAALVPGAWAPRARVPTASGVAYLGSEKMYRSATAWSPSLCPGLVAGNMEGRL